MAGTIAHILNVSIFDALELDNRRMTILYNEAYRQRMMNLSDKAVGSNPPKNLNMKIEKALKVHGPYTEGFHQNELNKLASSGLIPKV